MALELLRSPIRRVFFSQVTPLLAEEQVPPYRSRDAFEAVEVELSVARVIDLAFLVVVAWTFSLRTFWGIGMSVKSVVNLKFLSDCRFESLTRRTLECELASFLVEVGVEGVQIPTLAVLEEEIDLV